MKKLYSVLLACVGSLALAGAATAQPALQEKTLQIPGTQCSVTAWDYFSTENGSYVMQYGGGTSCAGNVGRRTLNVVPQVFNLIRGEPLWFSIGGEGLFQGPTPMSPLRLSRARSAVPSHIYRVVAYGEVTLPNGRTASVTVCPSCSGKQPPMSIRYSALVYRLPATSAQLRGIPCWVTQYGVGFPAINATLVMEYAGYLSCASSVTGSKTLEIGAQVSGPGPNGRRYYTITGSTLSTSSRSQYLQLNTGRTAYTGHPYRSMAKATVTYGGRTVSATAYSTTSGP